MKELIMKLHAIGLHLNKKRHDYNLHNFSET